MTIRAFRPAKINIGVFRGHKYNATDLRRQLDRLTQNFQSLAGHMAEQSPEILVEALEPTFEKSKTYCPKDTGDLVKSGYLEVRQTSRGAQAEMGYARGGRPFYAIYVHEVPRYHEAPTRWKWLQMAIQEDADQIQRRIVGGVTRAAGFRARMGTMGTGLSSVRGG